MSIEEAIENVVYEVQVGCMFGSHYRSQRKIIHNQDEEQELWLAK